MILLTRLNGRPFAVNPDLVERAEETPDTIITLVDGTRYVVTESLAEIARLMRQHRAAVLVAAHALEETPPADDPATGLAHVHALPNPSLRVVPGTQEA
jgi:flagellar protein FlbD